MLIIKCPSPLCEGCNDDMYGTKCHCICHKQDLFNGFHVIAWDELQEVTIVNPER